MIVIPTPELDSPAARALAMEGFDNGDDRGRAHEYLCVADTDYGMCFANLWAGGEPFVICEWDIIPWPGALTALLDCPEPWCTHRYPVGANLTTSFGIGKYRPTGPADPSWAETPWHLLDGFVVPVLNRLFGRPHVHEPPVAHCRANPEGAIGSA